MCSQNNLVKMKLLLTSLIFFSSALSVLSFAPIKLPSSTKTTGTCRQTGLCAKELMSEIDIMCLSNAADLCSYYDECDIEEREALMNRFEEQTDMMAERIATMNALVRHLKTGDHMHLEEEEVTSFKKKIKDLVKKENEAKKVSPLTE